MLMLGDEEPRRPEGQILTVLDLRTGEEVPAAVDAYRTQVERTRRNRHLRIVR